MQKITAKDLTRDHEGKRASFRMKSTLITGTITFVDPVLSGIALLRVEGLSTEFFLKENHAITIFGGN